jgi:hypothetical protein
MNTKNPQNAQPPRIDLDSHYGQIGISAVAAALQYKGETKAPANAPSTAQLEEKWLADIAA